MHAWMDAGRLRIDAALDRIMPAESEPPAELHRAMRYSVLAGGKRLRPLLALAAAEAVGADSGAVVDEACSLELLHTYTLVHDDLPAMDNDDLRRGKPTSHKVYGEAVAILAGDALQTLAFSVLAQGATAGRHAPGPLLEAAGMLARAAGSLGVIGGQIVDIQSEGRQVDRETLAYIHAHKTGALIEAAVMLGAILGGASQEQRGALSGYGTAIGLAFQITDDILDITSTPEQLGKTPGKDARSGKATYPALVGMEEARRLQEHYLERSLASLQKFGGAADPLRHIARMMVRRSS